MSKNTEKGIRDLCLRIGYEFQNRELLILALTHPSVDRKSTHSKIDHFSYERLEFLGDRVLGLIVAELLFHRFPQESEGSLAKRHAALVCGEALAKISLHIGLDQMIKLGKSEEESDGRQNKATLADACEALLGAIYADGGIEPVKRIISSLWDQMIAEAKTPPRDPKSVLQEWVQGRGMDLPLYSVVKTEGPAHAPLFTVRLTIDGFLTVESIGKSKRVAEQEVAKKLLEQVMIQGHSL
jgi:ribonuclease-3